MYAMQHVANDGDFSMEDETGEADSDDRDGLPAEKTGHVLQSADGHTVPPFPAVGMGEPSLFVSGRHSSIRLH